MPHLGKDSRPDTGGGDNLGQGGYCAPERSGAVTDPDLHSGWEPPCAMGLTKEQMTFLADLRKATRRATAGQDASVIGPLIRANLVRWDDDPSAAARRREPPGSTFTLTPLGEACLGEHEHSDVCQNNSGHGAT